MTIAIKICGLTDEAAIRAVAESGAHYAGFVYYPRSPRHLPLERAAALRALLPASVKSVSVLVDPDDALLAEVMSVLKPDYIQLHGKETPERLLSIRGRYPALKIMRGISVRTSDDVSQAMRFAASADMLLFDAKPPELPGMLPGGNGLSFDWTLLKNRHFPLPWMLSGGLNTENVIDAIKYSGATAVDVSSSVERAPGVKDDALIKLFVERAQTACA